MKAVLCQGISDRQALKGKEWLSMGEGLKGELTEGMWPARTVLLLRSHLPLPLTSPES